MNAVKPALLVSALSLIALAGCPDAETDGHGGASSSQQSSATGAQSTTTAASGSSSSGSAGFCVLDSSHLDNCMLQ